MHAYPWPYENEIGKVETVEADVLVLGGGLSGCFAAIAAARRGQRVILVEKGATEKSGSAGTGFDHWENACTNPCSGVTPEEIAWAFVDEQCGYSNGIVNYIGCREGYDRLLDIERFGGKIRDTEDNFAGAEFRDEENAENSQRRKLYPAPGRLFFFIILQKRCKRKIKESKTCNQLYNPNMRAQKFV